MDNTNITHLPHIKNTVSGINKYDPQHASIFEVYFTLPPAIQGEFKTEEAILTEQVTQVDGLEVLQKTTDAGSQKFFGVDASFLNPYLDNTYAELTIQLNLNIRNGNDAFILKVIKAWEKLSYDLTDGTRSLKTGYISDTLHIAEANRDGTIFRDYIFRHTMLKSVTGLNTLQYGNNDAQQLTIVLRSDYWEENMA